MADTKNTDAIDASRKAVVDSMRDAVGVLQAEETRLSNELARVRSERKDAEKMLERWSDTTPRRRRGRPRKNETAATETTPAA